MVNYMRLFICALACFFSITVFAELPGNPSDDTPQQSLDRWKQHLKNSDAYSRRMEEVKASIGQDSQGRQSIQQIVNKHSSLPDGSKVELKTVVTQPVDKAKVASTLTDRLKNAKDYAKNVGKASVPSFVGMAAFTALMEGIGWVMDEGGKVTKPNSLYDPRILPTDNYVLAVYSGYSPRVLKYYSKISYDEAVKDQLCKKYVGSNTRFSWPFDCLEGSSVRGEVSEKANPLKTEPKPEDTVVSDSELQTALKNALESNNTALAAAIADAIKSAYSYDGSEGQKPSSNTLAKEAADDMLFALPKAFDNPVPTSDPERPSGYAKITDGEKTLEAYVTPAPVTGTTDTTTTPVIDPVTGEPTGQTSTSGGFQFPPFCDWASVVCDWLDWTQEEPELPEEDSDIPSELLPVAFTPFQLVNFDATCPPDIPLELQIIGEPIHSVFPMQPFCTFFSGMQPFVLLLSMFVSVRIVAGSLNNTVF